MKNVIYILEFNRGSGWYAMGKYESLKDAKESLHLFRENSTAKCRLLKQTTIVYFDENEGK